MKACLDCGTAVKNLNYCNTCWRARSGERSAPDGASVASASPAAGSTPLDVSCDHVNDYGPEEGAPCGAKIGQNCRFSAFAPFLVMRTVGLGAAGTIDVHESRFRKWRGATTVTLQ